LRELLFPFLFPKGEEKAQAVLPYLQGSSSPGGDGPRGVNGGIEA